MKIDKSVLFLIIFCFVFSMFAIFFAMLSQIKWQIIANSFCSGSLFCISYDFLRSLLKQRKIEKMIILKWKDKIIE